MTAFEQLALGFGGDATEAAPAVVPAQESSTGPSHHPQANREAKLLGQTVRYAFRRARRRTIGFVVGPEGLSVSAPRWVALQEVESALQEKAAWILRKIREQGELSRRLDAQRIVWSDGACIPYLGRLLQIALDDSGSDALGVAVLEETQRPWTEASHAPARLRLALPPDAQPQRIRDLVHSWWQRQALELFEQRCAIYARQLGVSVRRIGLSAAQTRWGSAAADGSVRLNWRLIQFPLSTIDYVVVHELAHLREMNHSRAFWEVVRSVLPAYEAAQEPLRQAVPLGD